MKVTFKQFHGIPYQRFLINRVFPNGKIVRIGKTLAPNEEMAKLKAIELWNHEPIETILVIETPYQAQARFKASLKKQESKKLRKAK